MFITKIWYSVYRSGLTHWGRVMHICIGNLTTIVSDNGSSLGRRQAIIWRNKLHWNLKRCSYICIQENAFENVVWAMAIILSRPQCVKVHFTNCNCDPQAVRVNIVTANKGYQIRKLWFVMKWFLRDCLPMSLVSITHTRCHSIEVNHISHNARLRVQRSHNITRQVSYQVWSCDDIHW